MSRPRIAGIIAVVLILLLLFVPLVWPVPPLDDTVPPRELADADSRFAEIGGIEMHYKTWGFPAEEPSAGNDTAIVLLHGFGALGANGSGKSTLIGLLTRDVRPLHREDAPTVLFRGQERWDLFEARRVFGVVSADWQERYRVSVPVFDVVLSGFYGSVGMHPRHHPTPGQRARATALLGLLGIEHLSQRHGHIVDR